MAETDSGEAPRRRDRHPRVSAFRQVADLRAHLEAIGASLPCDEAPLPAPESPLAQPCAIGERRAGNRFAIQPMEGWDGTGEGMPTEYVRRRWRNFGRSGAKLIWGGEAFAVCPEGRANPNQLMACATTRDGVRELWEILTAAHRERFGSVDDLVVGLQLTHSGRFCRPFRKDRMEPCIAYRHPILDRRFGLDPGHAPVSDDYLQRLIELYVEAACIARDAGFHFVDVKHCHGYLGHELLSARTRPGRFGGSFENRTRFCREIVEGIRNEAPQMQVGVRLSVYDLVPFRSGPGEGGGKPGTGIPEPFDTLLPYQYGFGLDPRDPLEINLDEPRRFIAALGEWGVNLVNLTCGSPYYNPHIQRPALFPPSDGYQPPEDPLAGVARQIAAAARLKRWFPDRVFVGSGYSYLQEFLPHVAQAAVRSGAIDFVGLGRMVLSYPDLPHDLLHGGGRLARKLICRTFSDCTTAPRNGMVSGCFPLDDFYRSSEAAQRLKELKANARKSE